MHGQRRAPLGWATAVAIVGGMGLIGWAVDGTLPLIQTTALVFGIVLVAYGVAAAGNPGGPAKRSEDGATTN